MSASLTKTNIDWSLLLRETNDEILYQYIFNLDTNTIRWLNLALKAKLSGSKSNRVQSTINQLKSFRSYISAYPTYYTEEKINNHVIPYFEAAAVAKANQVGWVSYIESDWWKRYESNKAPM